MLIRANGDAIGTVSGGCLEADVMERAKRVINTGRAEVFTYDTTIAGDSVFSLNMGCRGIMRILLEPVSKDDLIIQQLRVVFSARHRVSTAVAITGERVGDRIFALQGAIGDEIDRFSQFSGLHSDLLTFAESASQFATVNYAEGDELVEFAFETLSPPVQLLILGAGADAVPLASGAHEIGWTVRVYDHRPAFLTPLRFPSADELALVDRSQLPRLTTDSRTAIVVMNHNYDQDKNLLAAALRTNSFYVGALGPKTRTQQMLRAIGWDGETVVADKLAILRSPAGLDIGGDSPETIALSIIAEIQSVLRGRSGGPLRDRTEPIYDHH